MFLKLFRYVATNLYIKGIIQLWYTITVFLIVLLLLCFFLYYLEPLLVVQ